MAFYTYMTMATQLAAQAALDYWFSVVFKPLSTRGSSEK